MQQDENEIPKMLLL